MKTRPLLYKFLGLDRKPCHGGVGQWPEPGVWTPRLHDLVPCRRGYHVCRPGDLIDWFGPELWRVEWRGDLVDATDKLVVGEARLIDRITTWNDRSARLFACDCADRVVKLTGPDERCVATIAVARRFAIGQATQKDLAAAKAAAKAAAWDAAKAAAWAAARAVAGDAVRGAAWDAARAAAWDAAREAAREAARYAAGGTARYAAKAAAWAAAGCAAGAAAGDAAWAAERVWQTTKLLKTLGLNEIGS